MALFVYRKSDGVLISWNQGDRDPVASDAELEANGLAKVAGLAPLDETHAWDPATKAVVTVAAPVVPDIIPTFDFILLFTAAENAAIRASSDQTVQHLLFALTAAPQVDLSSARIQQGVGYLESIGLIAPARAAAILSNTPTS